MTAWASSLVLAILTRLTSALLTKGLEVLHGSRLKYDTDLDVDQKLKAFKDAYREAFDGKPITPEQRSKLKTSIRDFISNSNNGGL